MGITSFPICRIYIHTILGFCCFVFLQVELWESKSIINFVSFRNISRKIVRKSFAFGAFCLEEKQ